MSELSEWCALNQVPEERMGELPPELQEKIAVEAGVSADFRVQGHLPPEEYLEEVNTLRRMAWSMLDL